MNIQSLKNTFLEKYGKNDNKISVFFAPGRVNLIGEHTDYNGGFVLPCAISFGTYLLLRLTNEPEIEFSSLNFDFSTKIRVENLGRKMREEWINYPLGVIDQFAKHGTELKGVQFLYYGNIPNDAGLSSSASIELVTAFAFNKLFNLEKNLIELIKLSQKAENEFVGVNCGIMDQFAVGKGKKNHAIFLNCSTLDYKLVPFKLDDYKLVIINSNKQRKLADSKYNKRVSECTKAVKYLNNRLNIKNLSELSIKEFIDNRGSIPDEIIMKRAKHVVSENDRVISAVEALKKNDLITFGKLMNASHDSLKIDYEVTGNELDTLIDEARKIDGVIGARMTGAGFGGCTVNLLKTDCLENFQETVGKNYYEKTGLKADFYFPEIDDGVRQLG
ncbi:MAG: galactokinase [Bacteroidales bacterium]|nr:galactokinase [Bacteroidales bacterium]